MLEVAVRSANTVRMTVLPCCPDTLSRVPVRSRLRGLSYTLISLDHETRSADSSMLAPMGTMNELFLAVYVTLTCILTEYLSGTSQKTG